MLEVDLTANTAVSETTKDGFSYVVYSNGTVAQATPSGALWATATASYAFAKYSVITGDYVDGTYYKYAEGKYSVDDTVTAETWAARKTAESAFTRANATAPDIAKLADQEITVRITGGARTRVVADANKPAGATQEQFAASGFATSGLASYADLIVAISGGVAGWKNSVNTVAYSLCGELADKTSTEVEAMTVGTHQDDNSDGSDFAAADRKLTVSFPA